MRQSILEITPISPNVAEIAKESLSLLWVNYLWILKRLGPLCIKPHQEEHPTPRLEDAVEFAHGLAIIGNDLQDMRTQNDVKCVLWVGNVGDIQRDHSERRIKVCT